MFCILLTFQQCKAFLRFITISKAFGQASPFIGSKDDLGAIKELLSFNIPAKSYIADESSLT
jgi:hypothetical protein